MPSFRIYLGCLVGLWLCPIVHGESVDDLQLQAMALLKLHCVKCHGPLQQEGKLNLALLPAIARGGEHGPVIVPGDLNQSPLWQRIVAKEMPPEQPLSDDDRERLEQWIRHGAPGLPRQVSSTVDGDEHWAFQALPHRGFAPATPHQTTVSNGSQTIDRFVRSQLQTLGLDLAPPADRATLIRRVSFDLTGLPPTPDELELYCSDSRPDAYERMVDRYLANPGYGERWGKLWLDAAGYADSNGYFNADTDRPLAFRYRDYVIRSINADKPWDQFLREQIAGDEIVEYRPDMTLTPDQIPLLEAVHFLRNSQDGTDSSDGNEDELRVDRYTVLEGMLQIIGSSMLGVTLQCAKCHDHKYEPITQRDYYQLQAVFYPAFNVQEWVLPKNREITTASSQELAAWQSELQRMDERIVTARMELLDWIESQRERGSSAAVDPADVAKSQAATTWWQLTLVMPPSAREQLAQRQTFRVQSGGNGSPHTMFEVHVGGNESTQIGIPVESGSPRLESIGESPWTEGHSYALRLRAKGMQAMEVTQIVDGVVESRTVEVPSELPHEELSGSAVPQDWNCQVERSTLPEWSDSQRQEYGERLKGERERLENRLKEIESQRPDKPGRLAFVTDLAAEPPVVPLLLRGNPKTPGDPVVAAPPQFLADSQHPADLRLQPTEGRTTGRRLALANWLTRESPRARALVARVTVNRWWSYHFGTGLVATPDNLGYSSEPPLHRELLDDLASSLVDSGWSAKQFHRQILCSETYRQTSIASPLSLQSDPSNRYWSRYPLHRLDAESIRDAMLAVSGNLNRRMYGPYIPTMRNDRGEVVLRDPSLASHRRSLYVQQRRTQVLGMLEVFDAPSMVANCTARPSTTVPLQSLQLLNSEFARTQAVGMAEAALRGRFALPRDRIHYVYTLCVGRAPNPRELALSGEFLGLQQQRYQADAQAEQKAWIDYCQMLLASNPFLYIH